MIEFLDRFAERVGAIIAPLMFLMMALTGVVVVARYLFNVGTTPIQESVVYLHGIVFMLGIAYTLKAQGHVRVDILYQRFSARTRAVIDLMGTSLFLLPVCGFIFWTSLDYVWLSWSLREASPEPGGLPGVYVLKMLIPAMTVLLAIQGVAEVLRSIKVITTGNG